MKLAINEICIGKSESKEMDRDMTFKYQNVDITQEELAESVNQGFAFCAQHKDKHRKSSNFICSDILAVDIDKGLTLEAALDSDFVNNYAAIVYTTQNHSDDFHRFRIIFELERTITSNEEMRHAYSGIINKFGGDKNCTDACRQFYGSKDCNPIVIGKTLTNEELGLLITIGEESKRNKNTDDKTTSERATTRSVHLIDIDTQVIAKGGSKHRLIDLPPRTPIHCPVHVDNKASAFVIESKRGVAGIHCSTCDKTYFSSSDVPVYDFDYGLTALKELEHEDYYMDVDHPYFDISVPLIQRYREKYLLDIETDTPFVLVKSPKGSGKTYWLESIVKKAVNKGKSVLLIGHRRSLISSVARRLKLNPYIDFHYTDKNGKVVDRVSYNRPSKRYAICVDSLPRLLEPLEHKYDIVIIDEVEQVFSHLTSDTVKYKRNDTYKTFKHYFDVADNVYLLDADLNKLTLYTICDFVRDRTKDVTIVINEREIIKGNTNELDLYNSDMHLQKEFIDSLNNNKKCFVCANSKNRIKTLHKYLENHFGDKKKFISITSDNSHQSEAQDFIRNIKERILDYDAVLVSPSVGTGVDITFPRDEKKIDVVYGFFEARVNTHFDIDQQLSRVRHPKAIRVWVSPETFRFETAPKVIKREVKKSERFSRHLLDIEPDGTKIYADDDDGYLSLYANVKSMQRGSKNKLKNHFVKMKKYNGWVINHIEMDEKDADACKEINKIAKELVELERINNIVTAKLITSDDYVHLKRKKDIHSLSEAEIHAMRRYEIESFYSEEISEELVKKDNKGKRRWQLREYELFTSDDSVLKVKDIAEHQERPHMTDKKSLLARKKLYIELLQSAGLADESGTLITNKIIKNTSLDKFINAFKKNKVKIERIFEIGMRKDIDSKPAQQLGIILKQLGIKWTKKQTGGDGEREYLYFISSEKVDALNDIVTRKNDKQITQDWHQVREETLENRLFEPILDQDDDESVDDILEEIRGRRSATAEESMYE